MTAHIQQKLKALSAFKLYDPLADGGVLLNTQDIWESLQRQMVANAGVQLIKNLR